LLEIKIELTLLILSVLFFLSILAGKISSRFGIPALLLFLGVGMLFGSAGFGISFDNISVAQTIGTLALCIILFSGGLDTKLSEVQPIIKQGLILATIGVFLTAIFTGVIVWFIFKSIGVSLLTSLLLASVMSSTDSASVFSILRSRGLYLKNNLRPMLEFESGSNDPMAYMLVITFIEIIKQNTTPNYWVVGRALIVQLIIGVVVGFVIGKLSIYLINKIKIGNDSLYPILVFTISIFIFSLSYYLKGNSYLAVYVGGLTIGNGKFIHKRSSLHFFDGLAWLSQLIMFLTLGLLVNPQELIPLIIPGLIISAVMIFIARPLTVFLSLLPFRKMGFKDKIYVSWVGLKGAVPIIFAVFVLNENVPEARTIFNIVFLCTLVSLLVQGTSLAIIAKWLGLTETPKGIKKLKNFDIDFSDEIKSIITEIEVNKNTLSNGNRVMDLDIPDQTLIAMIKRNKNYFIPKGNTVLKEKDKLLIITDNQDSLFDTLTRLEIKDF
jgi:cell volume regulation protein A